jgi:uncharacterized protein (DUF2062 family)
VKAFLARILRPFLDQLTQGVSPHELALAVALGAAIGVFPILGTTTTLCLVVGIPLGLNQPALQTANHVMIVPQFLMIPVFVKAGERLFRLDPVTFDPRQIPAQFMAGPKAFFASYGLALLAGVAVWVLVVPPLTALLYYVLRGVFLRKAGRRGATPAG